MTNTQPPVDRIRINNIEASIWSNTRKDGGEYFTVSFARKYRDNDDQLRNSTSFRLNDLLLLAKVVNDSHTMIVDLDRVAYEQRQSDDDDNTEAAV